MDPFRSGPSIPSPTRDPVDIVLVCDFLFVKGLLLIIYVHLYIMDDQSVDYISQTGVATHETRGRLATFAK